MTDDTKRLQEIEGALKDVGSKLDKASREHNKATNKLDRERVASVLDRREINTAIVDSYNAAAKASRELFDLHEALEREKCQIIEFAERDKAAATYQRLLAIRRKAEAPRARLFKAMDALTAASQECLSMLIDAGPEVWSDIGGGAGISGILFPSTATKEDVYAGFEENSMRALLFGRALELGKIANR